MLREMRPLGLPAAENKSKTKEVRGTLGQGTLSAHIGLSCLYVQDAQLPSLENMAEIGITQHTFL